MEELYAQIQSIFRDVFDNPELCVTENTTARDVPGWDSLTNINLIFAIEHQFKVKFALGEIQELRNVGEMVALVEKKRLQAGKR